ncbi:MAG: carboxylating nicotinate-nucleotide diphosphorylase [Deferribacteraceae bacterium]|jgi:nicotinate-nucleotide pyrophosphorylase (carboxylating)|nr:carboxylating nicotinate-nucleotide diphosphorylase [Deferribacteraceae bacterium]
MLSNNVKDLVKLALSEDIGTGDITTEPLSLALGEGMFAFVAKDQFVLAGAELAKYIFQKIDKTLEVSFNCRDGAIVNAGSRFGTVQGNMASILTAERIALNFLQRLSGIATNAFEMNKIMMDGRSGVSGLPVLKLLDTRKTTAGWRTLEKYAVRMGGGGNGRFGLYDAAVIKESHIDSVGGIDVAVGLVRGKVPVTARICVEVRNLAEVQAAVDAKADIIMIDGMDSAEIVQACTIAKGRAKINLSIGADLSLLRRYAKLPVDYISVGALTQTIINAEISLKLLSKKK